MFRYAGIKLIEQGIGSGLHRRTYPLLLYGIVNYVFNFLYMGMGKGITLSRNQFLPMLFCKM